MTDFDELRAQLRAAEQRAKAAAERSRSVRERGKRRQVQFEQLARLIKARPERHANRKRVLEGAESNARAEGARLDAERHSAASTLAAARAAFERYTDPRVAVTHLRDDAPFLLFPVRVETRFKNVGTHRQLWVRVFPDDCSFDTFEPVPSEDELQSARRYWAESWQAGGLDGLERAAWRNLVASHGSGRAAWLVENYRPVNSQSKPTRSRPEEVILVLTSEAAPVGADVLPIATFWRAMWIAGGKRASTEAARATLRAAVGVTRAADVEGSPPVNFRQGPVSSFQRDSVPVSVAFLVFPRSEDIDAQRNAWSRPPRVAAWPDRFVFVGYHGQEEPVVALGKPIPNPLIAGVDPSADPTEQLSQANGELRVPDEMKWMLDFDRAVNVGMGFRIDLRGPAAQRGFDKIIVLGVKAAADAEAGRMELEELIAHHRNGAHGMAVLGQGTPTNNTEDVSSGYTAMDEADETFDELFLSASNTRPAPSASWLQKTDGQWLAELLGIDPAAADDLPGSARTDQAEARQMNTTLWPGTFGYWMDTMMAPLFGADAIDRTRSFFIRHVSGRGPVPAVRIGRQPYGILLTTAFSRTAWMNALAPTPAGSSAAARERAYLQTLRDTLKTAARRWTDLSAQTPIVGGGGDPHQTLLDVVGLHPTSVVYDARYSEPFDTTLNRFRLAGASNLMSQVRVEGLVREGKDLLHAFGVTTDVMPPALTQFQYTSSIPLLGPVIDTVPLSEEAPIRPYTADKNYIEWLVTAARTSFAALHEQSGFTDARPPSALLYLMLRYALLEGYYDAGLQLRVAKLNLPSEWVAAARRAPPFINVDPHIEGQADRVALLTTADVRITGRPNVSVAEHVAQNLRTLAEGQLLREQIDALERLSKVPTARLERLFAEHVDCCGYRLDAWMTGLVHAQLAQMRNIQDGNSQSSPKQGVLLGAYGWLLDVRPRPVDFTPVQVPDATLRGIFNRADQAPLLRDTTNGGFIHAPSLNHAITAAVLRSGYLANATAADPGPFSVFLSSERVRRALAILDGMRAGQSLGALLGYQFERGLHDRHAVAEVDAFIYGLREAFPLRLDRLKSTKRTDAERTGSIEARDVVDGERLVEYIRKRSAADQSVGYPFGMGSTLESADANQSRAIDEEVTRLLDTADAVGDLLMAEGVYQAVHGNYDRVAATLDAPAGESLPPDPEVIRTPSRGFPLTSRVALHLDSTATANPRPGTPATPLSMAQPALNAWLGTVLPPLSQIACKVRYKSGAAAQAERDVTLADLGLQPIDVLRVMRDQTGNELVSHELRDRITQYLGTTSKPLDLDSQVAALEIDPMATAAAPVTLCRAASLIRTVRSLINAARPLRASDMALSDDAASVDDDSTIDRQRVSDVKAQLEALKSKLLVFKATWIGRVDDVEDAADRAEVVAKIDVLVEDAMSLLVQASAYEMPIAGWRFIHERRAELVVAVRRALSDIVDRWTAALAEFDTLMGNYAAQATDEERFVLLERAERRISTASTARPSTPSALRTTVQAKRQPFADRRDQFAALRDRGVVALSKLLTDWRALLPVASWDVVEPDLTPFERRAHALAADVVGSVIAVLNDIDDPTTSANAPKGRLPVADACLAAHDASDDPKERVRQLQAAGKALLGDGVTLLPTFVLSDDRADEIASTLADSTTLLKHLTEVERVDFPVDEWLYTCARVREPMQFWERMLMLTGALGVTEPTLVPLQLPYRENDRWMAGKLPAGYPAEGERLLYTASFAKAYAINQRHCGLLLDEWTEVLPLPEQGAAPGVRLPSQTTGVAFHYDRPNAQPPQTMLLVTPTASRGTWQWDDLLDAVNETIDLAKIRGVEPAQLDGTPYAIFLPATTTAASAKPITIIADLHVNNLSITPAGPP